MAFRTTPTPKFSAPVTVPIANDKGGFDDNTFTAWFKRPKTEELPALRQISNEDLVRSHLVGWDLEDFDTKQDVPFSPETKEAVLQIPPSTQYIALAFWEGVNGARRKN